MFLIYLFIFIFGAIIGSFLNVVILRLRANKNFIKGSSRCPRCDHVLSWKENIPLLSFVILCGRCKNCQKKIAWQYPVVELATGALFLVSFIFISQHSLFLYSSIILLLYYFIIISFLIIIFVYDLKYYLILDKIVFPAVAIVFLFQGLLDMLKNNFSPSLLITHYSLLLFSAIIISGFFLLQYLISKGKWIGGGDIRLGFLMGLILGWPMCLVGLFLAYLLGLLVGLPLLILGQKKMSSQIPFGTFLTAATLLTMFFGEKILNWYLSIL